VFTKFGGNPPNAELTMSVQANCHHCCCKNVKAAFTIDGLAQAGELVGTIRRRLV